MEEQQDKPELHHNYQVDQQVSVNAYFDTEIGGETVRFQLTARYGSTAEKIAKTLRTTIEAYQHLRQEFPRQLIPPVQLDREPKYQPVDDGGNDLPEVKTITADSLSVSMKDGKYYYKVIGKPFTQYGITVWPEVLEAAGVMFNDPGHPTTSIAGWRADYVEEIKDGKKRMKITRLLPPK